MIIRFITWIITIWAIFQIVKQIQVFFQKQKKRQVFHPNPQDSVKMVQDPVCHVYLPSLEAIQRTQDQKTYYFCSRQCAEKFSKPYRV